MSNTYIYPYTAGSASAHLLANALDIKVLNRTRSRTRFNERSVVFNWGCSRFHRNVNPAIIINLPTAVSNATNKLRTYSTLKENQLPTCEVTTDQNEAQSWLDNGHTVYGRDNLHGMGGNDITIYHNSEHNLLNQHVFYTKQYKNMWEIRVHVIRDKLNSFHTFVQRKVKPNGENLSTSIRNYENGWRFAHRPELLQHLPLNSAKDQAILALRALQLNFGAFDILIRRNGECCILECNTAPGIEGTTVIFYKEHLSTYDNYS